MTPQEAANVVAHLVAAFPSAKLDDERAKAYAMLIVDLERDHAEQAAVEVALTARWFPSVAEFREIVARRACPLPDFAEARQQVNAYAFPRSDVDPPEPHPLVRDALTLVGGVSSLRHTERETVWWAQFRDVYDDVRQRASRERMIGERVPLTYEPGYLALSGERQHALEPEKEPNE